MSQSEKALLPRHIHFVGIGGIGLSAIARVLVAWGHEVSGSDLRATAITEELSRLGIVTYAGHDGAQVAEADMVVVSSAVPETNPEVRAARAAGIPVLKRQSFLGLLLAGRYGIAVAGTHGKTTTSAMISVILDSLGYAPTFVVGGIIAELGTNARAGSGPHFVIEADEYDRAFHGLHPMIAVVTNLEMDHPDCYRGLEELRVAFGVFLDQVHRDGLIVACADSEELQRVLHSRAGRSTATTTYGFSPEADYVLGDVRANARGGTDVAIQHRGRPWCELALSIPGAHNALNATAALLVADRLGIERELAGKALFSFRGVQRRFEVKGERRGVLVIDDYAHHPTEVRATLAAARLRYPGRRLCAVWQPHTYSRTETLFGEFVRCFGDADEVIVTDIYAARAREVATIRVEALVAAMQHPHVQHIASIDEVVSYLLPHLRAGDVLLTLGAGDGYLIGERVLERLAP